MGHSPSLGGLVGHTSSAVSHTTSVNSGVTRTSSGPASSPEGTKRMSLITHPHPLASSSDTNSWMCDQCKRASNQNPGMYRYRCPQGCDFDLCGDCLQLQVQLGFGAGIAQESAAAEEEVPKELREAFNNMDTDGSGSLSKLKLITALARDAELAAFALPGVDCGAIMSDERSFDAADALFDSISKGKHRISLADFASHFKGLAEVEKKAKSKKEEMRETFDLIDADKSGSVSKLELIAAVQQNQAVDDFILPGWDSSGVMSDEAHFDRVDAVFEAIAGGRKRFCFTDFERYFGKVGAKPRLRTKTTDFRNQREMKRVFIIGPGFGRELNPAQGKMLEQAGFQVHWCWQNLPNPESPNFPVAPYLDQIKAELDQVQPDIVACASKGGVYLVGLWQRRYWLGPTLLINAHPTCQVLPQGTTVVLAQGSNDEVYTRSRAELESLIATGSENKCFLYYVANSGFLPNGQRSRVGDQHNMASLVVNDCLPRLIDAALCDEGPEVHMVRSWRDRLTHSRLDAEASLGYLPEQLRGRWASTYQRGKEEQKLFDVAPDSAEYQSVLTVFKAHPKETPAYYIAPESVWDKTRVVRIQRVENGYQEDGCVRPYYETMRRSLEDKKIEFEPGTHTVWAFHGTADRKAIESIVTNPVAGFQPLASGSRGASLWGLGTYFARDASYVAHGGFCGPPSPDGTRQMLMCLLATGIPCLGDPQHKGVLPFRAKPHRYNSSVDSLSSPEIYIIQHPGAAIAAYLITYSP